MAFLRQIELIVGAKGEDGFKISNLRIAFEIEKTEKSENNTGKIRIYNLSKDTHNKISTAGLHCILKAGYQDESIRSILFGDIVRGERKKSGTEYITELEVKDGREAVMNGYVSVSYEKNTEARLIAQDMLDVMALPYKGIENIPASAVYPGAFSDIGLASDILKKVLNRFDLYYCIQNEMVYIMTENKEVESTGLLLSPETGLLTIPCAVSDKTSDDDNKAAAGNEWTFRTLLFPQLNPGVACVVNSPEIGLNATMKIKSTKFVGDNYGQDFYIDIKAEVL